MGNSPAEAPVVAAVASAATSSTATSATPATEASLASLQPPSQAQLIESLQQSVANKIDYGNELLKKAANQEPGFVKRLAINDRVEPALDVFYDNLPKSQAALETIQQSFDNLATRVTSGEVSVSKFANAVDTVSRDADDIFQFAQRVVGTPGQKRSTDEKLAAVNGLTDKDLETLQNVHVRLAAIAERCQDLCAQPS